MVHQQPAPQGLAEARDQLDGLEGLQATDDAAERAKHARLAAARHAPRRGRRWKQAAVTRSAARGIEDCDLAVEFEDAAVHERTPREAGGVVVEIAGAKIVGAVDNHVVAGEEGDGVVRRDAAGVRHDADERIDGGEAGSG